MPNLNSILIWYIYFTATKILINYFISPDPANPIQEDRRVSYLTPQRVVTRLGTSQRITISNGWSFENCHVRTPANLQYKVMEGFNVPNVQVIEDANINCGVTIYVESEKQVGTWTLISREGFNSDVERRLQFTIDVDGN